MNSKEIGKRLRAVREHFELTQLQLAELFGKNQASYSKYESGSSELDYKSLSILASRFQIDLNWFIQGSPHSDDKFETYSTEKNIPLITSEQKDDAFFTALSTIPTNFSMKRNLFRSIWDDGIIKGQYSKNAQEYKNTLNFLNQLPKVSYPNNRNWEGFLMASEVSEDSMVPTITEGSIVYFILHLIEGNGIYALSIKDRVFIRRIEFNPMNTDIMVHSDNPHYSSLKETLENSEIKILGKVKSWLQENK